MARATILVSDPTAHLSFCGRTLVDRHVELLRRAGVRDIAIVERAANRPGLPARAPDPFGPGAIVVTAERIFDGRLYRAALEAGRPVVLTDAGVPIGLEVIASADAPATPLDVGSMEPYSRELRRRVRPYWLAVHGPGDRPRVRRMLIESSYKGHQDLPAEFFNRPLETAILRWTGDSRITPNRITFVCNLLAYLVAALFALGHPAWAVAGAVTVGVLDGVDGRQARVQLRTSSLGALEHLLDKAYEIAWMVALAFYLTRGSGARSVLAALAVWTAAYLLDTAAYDVFKWRTGSTLDEASRIDAAIRRVAGRRNVYVWMLAVGVAAGALRPAFFVVAGWAAATAVVHWARVLWILLPIRRVAPVRLTDSTGSGRLL